MTVVSGLAGAVLLALAVMVLRGPPPGAELARRLLLARDPAQVARPVEATISAGAWPLIGFVARRRSRRVESAAVREVAEAWSRELQAGADVATALVRAIDGRPGAAGLVATRSAVLVGADVGSGLRADLRSVRSASARRGLSALGACWAVAGRQGGALADALDRVGDGLRADEHHVAQVRSELAGARASARMLAVLPVFALLLAAGLGMNPLAVLVGDPIGRIALVSGAVLDGAGLWWTARIARAAERAA